jgi:hypothetical protein
MPTGRPCPASRTAAPNTDLGHGLTARHSFSSKPSDLGYPDYYAKMSTYATIVSGPAAVLQPGISPRVFRGGDEEEEASVFNYLDTASSRVGIGALASKLEQEVVAIIGLGGTGGYILDFVAKTPVKQIRLFDPDVFLSHNAFRAPGAPTLEELRDAPKKVHYLKGIYERMHRYIEAHPVEMNAVHSWPAGRHHVRVPQHGRRRGEACRRGQARGAGRAIHRRRHGAWSSLMAASAASCASRPARPTKREHVHQGRISFAGGGGQDAYASNIQVADLNALNACLAVVKWKKLRGFLPRSGAGAPQHLHHRRRHAAQRRPIVMRHHTLQHRFVRNAPRELEPSVLYISMEYATAVHSCCCGCGERVVTPFTPTDWASNVRR